MNHYYMFDRNGLATNNTTVFNLAMIVIKDVLHRCLFIAFMFNGGKLPALTIHVSSDMYMGHCFLAPWAYM